MRRRYSDILSDMERQIEEGRFAAGQKLPSVRQAAELYGCSAGTIARAYAELEKRHAVYSIAQSGYYVVENPENRRVGTESMTIDFASSSPDPGAFPYMDFRHCLNKALDTYQAELFTCGEPLGLPTLRRALVSHLADGQVFAPADRIVVTSGANQALEILARMPFPNRKTAILVEQPSYDLYLRYLEAEGIPVCGIARTVSGIDLKELEERFRSGGIKFFYTIPRYHCPLGTSYGAEERKAIARLASKYDVYVVEDDYMADLGEEPGRDPIFAYNETSHAIYVKSFSKIVFPGLRLGVAVLPEKLMKTFAAFKRYSDTSQLSQAALELYIQNGMYERHKRHIRDQYASRIRAVNEALRRHNDEGWIEAPELRYGVYVPFKLPRTVRLERLIRRLAEKKIDVVSGKRYYLAEFRDWEKLLWISVARARPERIEDGVREIVEEVRREAVSFV